MKTSIGILVFAGILINAGLVSAADWPQWGGPQRNNQSAETALLDSWPTNGPRLSWSVSGLGKGYSSIAVAGDKVLTAGMVGSDGILSAFDVKGLRRWKTTYGQEWTGSNQGSRSTPTVNGDQVYLMSSQGKLVCFGLANGKIKWSVDTLKEFKGKNIGWGISESVLVDGKNVICTPGGQDASVVALDKMTGKTVWTSKGLSESSGYCSPILVERGGTRLIVTLTAKSVVGLDAAAGTVLWTYPHQTSNDVNAVTPLYQDGCLFVTSGYGAGSAMLQLSADGREVKELWSQKQLDNHHGGVVLLDGVIYGTTFRGSWVALDFKTGQVKFQAPAVGKGSVIAAAGLLYGYGENGLFALMEPTSTELKIISSFRVPLGSNEHWAHPVIADGRLYLRHGDALMCFDIREPKK